MNFRNVRLWDSGEVWFWRIVRPRVGQVLGWSLLKDFRFRGWVEFPDSHELSCEFWPNSCGSTVGPESYKSRLLRSLGPFGKPPNRFDPKVARN